MFTRIRSFFSRLLGRQPARRAHRQPVTVPGASPAYNAWLNAPAGTFAGQPNSRSTGRGTPAPAPRPQAARVVRPATPAPAVQPKCRSFQESRPSVADSLDDMASIYRASQRHREPDPAPETSPSWEQASGPRFQTGGGGVFGGGGAESSFEMATDSRSDPPTSDSSSYSSSPSPSD